MQNIETQEDLAKALLERGYNVTQATVSRDIKEMMLIKVPNVRGGYSYACLLYTSSQCMSRWNMAAIFLN